MNNELLRKGFALSVILLISSIAIIPSITAQIDESYLKNPRFIKNKELVEITCEITGFNEIKKHIATLTQEDALNFEKLIENVKLKLDKVKTKEETITIFNDALESLNDYGILPEEINTEEAQRTVTGYYQKTSFKNVLEKQNIIKKENEEYIIDNTLCLIAGNTDYTVFSPIGTFFIAFIEAIFTILGFRLIPKFIDLILVIYIILTNSIPVKLLSQIVMGIYHPDEGWFPANGWLFTIGLKGIKSIQDSFYGQISAAIGAYGFTGLRLRKRSEQNLTYFYMGSALSVKVDSEPPFNP